jgi:flagellar biosynthesis protein FlhF
MRLKIFQASHMAEAMTDIREEFGLNAVILTTRRTAAGVEITAALEPDPEEFTDNVRLSSLVWHGVPSEYHFALCQGKLEQALEPTILFGSLPLKPDERPILLTGPPGAGKTLTTVRLATRLVMQGIIPMVITTDGKRAGAAEELAAFTRLLGIPLLVANHPFSLVRALAHRRNGAPVLIDTAGSNIYEPTQAKDLEGFAAAARAHVVLVLPAGLDAAEAADIAVAHAHHGALSLIATRLDLSRRLGGVIAASATSRLTLTEAGIGPGAADGLIPFTPVLLASRLSPPKVHFDVI